MYDEILSVLTTTECEDVRKPNINISADWRMPVLVELNERATSIEELREAVNEKKCGKPPRFNGFPVE